jgi:outer membrane protein assembly factor BamB
VAATLLTISPLARVARAQTHGCTPALQQDVCLQANPNCPAASPPFGVITGTWPVFQGNVQHTGVGKFAGPTCNNKIWSTKLQGGLEAQLALAPGHQGEPETLFVPVGKAPICALNPVDGSVYWCQTDFQGKLADRSTPVIGNGGSLYIGTRDNDLWAIDLPPVGDSGPTVEWQQFVCTDGDITAPPIISKDGLVFMGSDSLGAGTLMAMCPGPTRQAKWCINPLGGGIRNASPALSPSGNELYVLFGGGSLVALDPQTGAEHWRVQLESKRSIGRIPNHAPVVNPTTGRIYVNLRKGVWAVDPPAIAGQQPTVSLLFSTAGIGRVEIPVAVDVAHNRIVVGVFNPLGNTLFGLNLAGAVQWQRSDFGIGRFRANNPAVIDTAGRIYLTFGESLFALDTNGNSVWQSTFPRPFLSAPILGNGRVYAGTKDGTVYAIGDCA